MKLPMYTILKIYPDETAKSTGIISEWKKVTTCDECIHNYGLTHGGGFDPEDIVCDYFETDGMTKYDYCSMGKPYKDG